MFYLTTRLPQNMVCPLNVTGIDWLYVRPDWRTEFPFASCSKAALFPMPYT